VYPLVLAGLAVIVGFPRLTTAVPSPLVAVVLLTVITLAAGLHVPTLGDQGALPDSLPSLVVPDVPYTWATLGIIAPYALGLALVGLLESLMTAKLVDEITDTPSNKTREAWGQGVANVVTGCFGGMGGCALIGQTMINVRSGARTRLSTFLAGVFLLLLVVAFGSQVARIPMAALVAVMIFVAFTTLDRHSLRPRTLRAMPRGETLVMVSTVAVVIPTHNLAYGVVAGTVVATLLFARRVAHMVYVRKVVDPDGTSVIYAVHGELFFASSEDLVTQFDYAGDPADVVVDMSEAHVWDASSVAALDAITAKYAARGKTARITGLNPASADFRSRLAGRLTSSH
jgi:SulP family sulfate permease